MSNPDDNLPPQTSKFFDIIPANKRSSASPTSRPLIVDNSPTQSDSMINADQQPDIPEAVSEEPVSAEPVTSEPTPAEIVDSPPNEDVVETTTNSEPVSNDDDPSTEETDSEVSLPGENITPDETDVQPATETEDFPVVQTDIETSPKEDNTTPSQIDAEQTITTDQPDGEELLLPAEATPDETPTPEVVAIHSPDSTSKSFRLRTWLIALLFVIIIIIIGLLLYLFVFKSTVTNTPNTQFLGFL